MGIKNLWSKLKLNIWERSVGLLVIFHLIGNSIWIFLNNLPLSWDPSGHTLTSFKFVDYLIGDLNTPFLKITDYYPPVVHLTGTLALMLFGINTKILPLVDTLYFCVAIVFLFLWLRNLFNDRMAFLSTLTFSLLPFAYSLSRDFLLDIPSLALTFGALYSFEKSQMFKIRKYAIMFSIFFGLGLLTKWTVGSYLLLPLLFNIKKINFRKIVLPVVLVLLIVGPWYLSNLSDLIRNTQINLKPETANPQSIWSFENWIFYLRTLINFQEFIWGFGLMISGAVLALKLKLKNALFLLLQIVFLYLVFSLIGNKNIRYTLMIPVLGSGLIGFLLDELYSRMKWSLIIILIWFGFLIMNYFSLSFGFPIDPEKVNSRISVNTLVGYIDVLNFGRDTAGFLAPKFKSEVWPQKQILQDLATDKPKNILVLLDKERINPENLKVERRLMGISNINIIAPYSMVRFETNEELEKYLATFDFVLMTKRDFGPVGAIRYKSVLEQIRQYVFNTKSAKLHEFKSYDLPDGDKLIIYEQNVK